MKNNLVATVVALLGITAQAAHAQHFYDHDRQWKHGGVTGQGTVPEDYIRPVAVSGEITRSTPPFGYSAAPRQAYDVPIEPTYYHARRPYDMRGKTAAKSTYLPPRSMFNADDLTVFENAQAGLDPSASKIPSPPKPAKTNPVPFITPSLNGPLILGGGGTPYRMTGRGQY